MKLSDFVKQVYNTLFGVNPEFKSTEEKIEEFKQEKPELFDVFIRKYIGTNPYSDHLGRINESFYAVTYENNDTNREDELSYEIKERFHLTHIPDYGYDDNEEVDNIEGLPVFPDIEVGRI